MYLFLSQLFSWYVINASNDIIEQKFSYIHSLRGIFCGSLDWGIQRFTQPQANAYGN